MPDWTVSVQFYASTSGDEIRGPSVRIDMTGGAADILEWIAKTHRAITDLAPAPRTC